MYKLYLDLGKNYGINLQDEGSNLMIGIRDLHEYIMYYLIIIIIIVRILCIKNNNNNNKK